MSKAAAMEQPRQSGFPEAASTTDNKAMIATSSLYDVVTFVLSVAAASLAFLLAFSVVVQPDETLRRRRYLRIGLGLLVWCLVAPLLYWWIAPSHLSVADVTLLRVRTVGWRHPIMAYCAFVGYVLGGAIGAARARTSSPDPSRDE